ncbi:hypothetical protein [Enemella dayhoffiae]|uniref:hypothetical protein n=1 Tax=Enemella dayhoffiae TaxID=2016507 RepID=UPI0011400047|nr:hypothetical protein [Enemella dayhoffiae]
MSGQQQGWQAVPDRSLLGSCCLGVAGACDRELVKFLFDTTIPIDQRAAPEGYANEIFIRVCQTRSCRGPDGRLWLRSLGGGVFAALRGGLVAAIMQDWLQVGVAV